MGASRRNGAFRGGGAGVGCAASCRGPGMRFKSVLERDGTYSIRSSRYGLNWEVVMQGVRGCNVQRVLTRFYNEWSSEA